MIKILELDITNFKRIKAVQIKPGEDNLVFISGANEQGKSSTLDAIKIAIEGPKGRPGLIRNGEEKSVIETDLGEFSLSRVLTKDGKTSLRIETETGAKVNSPAAFLKEISGGGIVDISDFLQGDKAEARKTRLQTIAEICNINFEEISKNKKEVFEERTSLNRELKRKQGSFQDLLDKEGPLHRENIETVDTQTLVNQATTYERLENALNTIPKRIEKKKEKILDLQKEITRLQEENKELEKELKEHKEDIKKLPPKEEITKKLKNANELNQKLVTANSMKALSKEIKSLKKESESLTDRLKEIDLDLQKKISKEISIEGLTLEEDRLLYNGVFFEEVASSRKMKIAIAVAMAKSPRLRVLLLKDGSLLDKDSISYLEELSKKHEFQVWIEVVDSSGDFPIVIEDGEYKESLFENSKETKPQEENIPKKEDQYDEFSLF